MSSSVRPLTVLVGAALLAAGCASCSTAAPSPVTKPPPAPSASMPAAAPVATSTSSSAPDTVLAEDTALTTPNGTAAPVVAGTVTADRTDLGYVAALLTRDGGTVLRLDRVQEVSNAQLVAEGKPPVANNGEIVDDNPELRDDPVAADATIALLDGSELKASDLNGLVAAVSAGPFVLVDLTYDAQGAVTAVAQHYRP